MIRKLKSFFFENKTVRQTVAKNTFWLAVSNFGGRLLRAILVIYSARILGTAEWGVFSYGITLAGFITLFMDPGLNAILTRNTAKSSEEGREAVFSTIFVIKLVLIAVGILIVLLIAPSFSTLPGAKTLLPIIAFILACDTLRDFFSALLRGKEKMEWDAFIQVLMNAAILAFGFFLLSLDPTARALAWGYALGTAVGALIATVIVRSYLENIAASFSGKLVMPLLKSAWPFAVTSTLGLLLTNTDILIVSWMRTASDVGIYSAAIRIIQVIYLIPTVVQLGILPLFSRLAAGESSKFRAAFEETLSLLFLISIPLALGGALLGTPIMVYIFGASYAAGGLPFKILMITMLVDFPAAIISNAIFAHDHQKSLIISSAIGGIANVALDLLLIPPFGIVGSAVGTLIAQTASNWYLWHTMNKINPFSIVPRLKKTAAAGVIMAGFSFLLLRSGAHLFLTISASALLYFALLKIFREPTLREIKNVVMRAAA